MFWQRTIKRETSSTGIGLHSGKKVKITFKPAPPGAGIIYKRTDLPNFELKATEEYLFKTDHATSICNNEIVIDTVEHLMAALVGTGIDNIIIEINSSEIPAMDGSASPFVFLLHEAGIRKYPRKRKIIRITRPLEIKEDNKFIALYPSDEYRITYRIDFDHPAIRQQEASFIINERTFSEEIAPARTFGFLRDVEMLRRRNLARGGSLDNAVILDEHKIINNPLRFDNEFVRHKILDAVGDFAFLKYKMLGHLVVNRGGHALHIKMVKHLFDRADAWELITETDYNKILHIEEKSAEALSPLFMLRDSKS